MQTSKRKRQSDELVPREEIETDSDHILSKKNRTENLDVEDDALPQQQPRPRTTMIEILAEVSNES